MTKEIRTFEELSNCIADVLNKTFVSDEFVFNFVAGQFASELKQCSHSELMQYLIEGIPPMSKRRVLEWIDTQIISALDDDLTADDGFNLIRELVINTFENSVYSM